MEILLSDAFGAGHLDANWANIAINSTIAYGHYYILHEEAVTLTCESGPRDVGFSSVVYSPFSSEQHCYECGWNTSATDVSCENGITAECGGESSQSVATVVMLPEEEGADPSRLGTWTCGYRDQEVNVMLEELGQCVTHLYIVYCKKHILHHVAATVT